jgi:diguanylate cyclase
MGLVAKILGSTSAASGQARKTTASANSVGDGAIDTLGHVVRIMGYESFPLENDIDPAVFPTMCAEFAAHVENGAGVPSLDIPPSTDGTRQWARLRRFFSDRRQAEKAFVTERLHDYRGVVEDLVGGLRRIAKRDESTESSVKSSLNTIEDAVSTGVLPDIRAALTQTVVQVTETFAVQKKEHEQQLLEMNERMSGLRQDLVAAQEEMQRDALTDAFNRGAFDGAIEQSLNSHFILNQPVTLVMVDLDNFKQINDNYGHSAGDEVLRAVGEGLARSFIRKNDIIARYGGDEFAIILNDTSAELSVMLIERFLEYVNNIEVPGAPDAPRVSCSAGFTEIHSSDTVKSLIRRADRALYQAKDAGRNCLKCLMYSDDDTVQNPSDAAGNQTPE